MRSTLLAFAVLVASTAQAGEPSRVTIVGNATLRGHADYAVVTFRNMVVAKESSAAALSGCRQTIRRALAVLNKRGIKAADVSTLELSLRTLLDTRRGEAPRVVGYEATQTLQVFIRSLKDVADLIQVVLDAGVTEVISTRYRTSQPKAFREHARKLALADAFDKAAFMADALNKKLGLEKIENVHISFSDAPWASSSWGGSRAGREAFLSNDGEETAWDYGVALPDLGRRIDSETPSMIRVNARVTAAFVIGT